MCCAYPPSRPALGGGPRSIREGRAQDVASADRIGLLGSPELEGGPATSGKGRLQGGEDQPGPAPVTIARPGSVSEDLRGWACIILDACAWCRLIGPFGAEVWCNRTTPAALTWETQCCAAHEVQNYLAINIPRELRRLFEFPRPAQSLKLNRHILRPGYVEIPGAPWGAWEGARLSAATGFSSLACGPGCAVPPPFSKPTRSRVRESGVEGRGLLD